MRFWHIGLGVFCGMSLMATLSMWNTPWFSDSTDPPGGHSGLVIFTDHKTGVEYVGNVMGGMTVRVDRGGKPIVEFEN